MLLQFLAFTFISKVLCQKLEYATMCCESFHKFYSQPTILIVSKYNMVHIL